MNGTHIPEGPQIDPDEQQNRFCCALPQTCVCGQQVPPMHTSFVPQQAMATPEAFRQT